MQTEIKFNNSIVERFALLRKRGRLAHAYLFVGPPDIGKGETALAVAKFLHCEAGQAGQFCDACPACAKINSGNHPDVAMIDNDYGESIKIEQIRVYLERSKLRSFFGAKKIFIIRNIEHLTLEGANAFLKMLEEPAGDSLLLLTTAVLEKVLDTVKSRCHLMYFHPQAANDLIAQLRKNYTMNEQSYHFLAYFAQGSVGAAMGLSERQFVDKKNELIDRFILNRPGELQIKELLEDEERIRELLDILLSWIRDALIAKAGGEHQRFIHLDRVDDLKRFMQRYTFMELDELNKSIVRMRQLLADNLNIKLPLLIIGEQLWGK
jgi:DNA polymerase-3 subunit delta'